jgi:hypothetical protein
MNKQQKREIATIIIIAAFAIFVIYTATKMNDVVAPFSHNVEGGTSSSSKIKVRYTEVNQYFGNGNIVIKNLDSKKTIVSEKLNFQKQHDSQGQNCCVKTYDFKTKGNHEDDRLFVKVTANGGSWSQHETLHLPNMSIRVSMDEVWCGVHGDECD